MEWRIVRQPNGMFARFSEIVDDFTHMNMTEEEVLKICGEENCSIEWAKRKLDHAKKDIIEYPNTIDRQKDGSHRWKKCLDIIKAVHGEEVLKECLYIDQHPEEEGALMGEEDL